MFPNNTCVQLFLSRMRAAQPYSGNDKRSRFRSSSRLTAGLRKIGLFLFQVYFLCQLASWGKIDTAGVIFASYVHKSVNHWHSLDEDI